MESRSTAMMGLPIESTNMRFSPRKIDRLLRKKDIVRAANVYERDADGRVCERTLAVEDIESRTPEPREVIELNEETEQMILRSLRIYKGTVLYVAFMVTMAVLILVLQLIF